MSDKVYNVLFVCTHNSARSIMDEGLMNSMGGRRFKAYSAGSQPSGTVNPFALTTSTTLRIPNDGYRSKDWSEFARPMHRNLISSSRSATTPPVRSARSGQGSR